LTELNSLKSFLAKKYFSLVETFAFDNGLKLYVNKKNDAPSVSVQCWVATGSIHEKEFLGCGLSHFLEHMLFQGCEGYPGHEAADTVNRLGGDINAYTSYGHTVYHLELPAAHVETGIDILAKMVSAPLFPEDKFISEKDVILRERDMVRDRPERVLTEKLWQNVFLVHPVKHPIIGYKEKIESVSRELMTEYYRRRYSPERCFFVISGQVNSVKVVDMIRFRLDAWGRGDIHDSPLPEEPQQLCRRNSSYTFPDPLSRIAIGCRIPSAYHTDIPALDLLCGIMGQDKSSRMITRLKLQKELAVSIGSFSYSPVFSGVMGVIATAAPDRMNKLEEEIFSEISLLRHKGVTKEEVEREKLQQATEYLRSLKSNSGIAAIIGNSVLTYGSPLIADHYLDILSKVHIDDIQNAAVKYLDEQCLSTIKLLPESAPAKKRQPEKPVDTKLQPEKSILPSGASLIFFKDEKIPLVDICMAFPGGTLYESKTNVGISRIISNMLTAGTASFSEEKLTVLLDDNAIDLTVSAGANSFVLRVNCIRDRLSKALDIMKSILSEPFFGQKELAREKHNAIEALKSRKMAPSGAAEDKVYALLYPKHPYGLSRGGSEKSIEAMTSATLKEFYLACLNPEKTVFGIAGDISPEEAGTLMQELDSAIPWNKTKHLTIPPAPEFPDVEQSAEIVLPREQTTVIYAVPGCDNKTTDRFAFDILQDAINGMSSNMFKTLRDTAGLAYSTGAICTRGFHSGIVGFYAGTERKSAQRALDMLRQECVRLGKSGIKKEEFLAARESALFSCAEMLERSDALLLSCVFSEYYGNGFMTPLKNADIFRNLTLKQVNSVLKKYFSKCSGACVIAGPAMKK